MKDKLTRRDFAKATGVAAAAVALTGNMSKALAKEKRSMSERKPIMVHQVHSHPPRASLHVHQARNNPGTSGFQLSRSQVLGLSFMNRVGQKFPR